MKALVGAFNQEKALVGAFSVIVKPMEHYTALLECYMQSRAVQCRVWLHARGEGFRKLAEVLHPPSPAQRQQQCRIVLEVETYLL